MIATKIALIAMLVAITLAGELGHHVEEHHYAHPKYEFKYGVKDEHTHDIKEQAEKRDGDKVQGHYMLNEADGTIRTVHYTADKHTGFHAHVHRTGHAVHPIHQHHHHSQQIATPIISHHEPAYKAHPKYEFKYGVKDEHTHDIKEQAEKRDGDKVEGHYMLHEADGTIRTVHYTADKHTGFHAHVHRTGHAVHPIHQQHHHSQQIATPIISHHEPAYKAHPKYEFKYGVKDEHTHDIKEQAEKRDGDKVQGHYMLHEADGTIRTVHYTADKHTGFHAHVHRTGHAVHPIHHHHHSQQIATPVISHQYKASSYNNLNLHHA